MKVRIVVDDKQTAYCVADDPDSFLEMSEGALEHIAGVIKEYEGVQHYLKGLWDEQRFPVLGIVPIDEEDEE